MAYSVQFIYQVPGAQKPRVYGILLTWVDSTDPNAASENIYRATVSGGPYTKIANVGLGVQSYMDFGVTPEIKYYYVMTEVDSTSTESGFSIETSGTPGWIP